MRKALRAAWLPLPHVCSAQQQGALSASDDRCPVQYAALSFGCPCCLLPGFMQLPSAYLELATAYASC
eukprot:6149020-Pleurochrysis_carterae.AAC.3